MRKLVSRTVWAGVLQLVLLVHAAPRLEAAGLEEWTPAASGVGSDLLAVRHIGTGGYSLAVGAGGRMLTSPDGLSWTPRAVADAWGVPVTADLTGIAEVTPHVVVVGDGVILRGPGSDPALISGWQVLTIGGRSFRGVAADPDTGVYVAVGGIQTDAPYVTRTDVAVSTGGSVWSVVDVGDIGPLNAVLHANGLFVATGWGSQILTSPNGTDWTVRQGLIDFTMQAITHGTHGVLAAGLTGLYYTSTDGMAWSEGRRGSSLDVFGAAFGDGTYCTVGSYAGIHTSTDAESWTFRDPGIVNDESARLNAVTFHNHRFLVVGNGGIILRSGIAGISPILRVTVEPPEAGATVPAATIPHEFPLGSEVELTASAAPGYRFLDWAGDYGGSMPSLTVRMDGDVTVTANFARQGVERIEGEDAAIKRMGHVMAVLPNGKTALFGGHGWDFTRLDSAEVWDPAAGAFATKTMPTPCDGGAFVRLADGRYLLAGGAEADLGVPPGLRSAMVFDPATETFAAVAGQMSQGRMHCRGALLTDGRVLIVGGWFTPASAASGEIFDPAGSTFSPTGALNFPRAWPMVLPTADGGAVVAGGTHHSGSSNVEPTEIYDPATNGFAPHTESLFPGEPGWILNTDLPRDLGTQMTASGEYVLHAYRADTRESALAFFNPATKSFRRLALTPPLTEFATWTFSPLVNPTRHQAFLVMSNHPPGVPSSSSWPVVVDLDSGKRSTAPVSSRTADYWIGGSAQILLPDGRIFITGGSESVNWYFNFRPVEHTFYLAADYILGPPSVVDHDLYEIRINPTNTHMVRDAAGTLHVAYTRRQWPASAPGYYAYVRRSTDDGQTWANRVRTEDMPDSAQVYSLAIAPDGTLHQGFTFNVGTFVTSSADGGATWSKPTALRDGGWGDYDYSPALAVDAGGALHAVFAQLFGWNDPPANVIAKTRPSAGSGWWNGVALTDYPNSEDFGLGATNPRLCLGPGGRRYALFDQTTATATRRLLAVFDGVRWHAPAALSNPARQGYGGDAAVDSAGWLHTVWIERDHAAANAELRYAVYGPDGTQHAPPRNLTSGLSANVHAATVGAYAGDRIIIAYGLADAGTRAGTAYHGVFVRSSGDDFARSIRVADHPNARTPALRSAFGMHRPAKLDILWVEPAPESEGGGDYLMHRLLVPDDLEVDRGTIAVTSSVPDAPFTLTGPRTYAAGTGAAGAWTEHGIPVGTYTITWGDKTGYATPAGEAKRLTVGATAAFAGLYVPDDSVVLALDVAPADGSGGTVTLDPAGTPLGAGRFRFPQDTLVALTAAPADGWRLKEWSGALAGEETTASLTLAAGAAVTATFVPRETFAVTTRAGEHGTISPATTVRYGEEATVTITPDPGAHIASVAVNDVPVEAEPTVVLRDIRGDVEVRAEFAMPRVVLHCLAEPGHGGTVVSDQGSYAVGETATVTATPASGFRFVGWSGAIGGAASPATVTMADNRQVTARFAAVVVSGDVDANGVVDVRDAEKAYRMAVGLDPADLARADLDHSGTVTPRDAALILRAVTDGIEKVVLSQPLAVTGDDQVASLPGRVTVTVPGGLLTEPAELTITEIGNPPAPFRQLLPGSPVYRFAIGSLTEFDRDVLIEFDYDAAALPPAEEPLEDRLLAGRWDEEGLFWQLVPATVDTARSKLVVPVRHFSYYGMLNPWQKTLWTFPFRVIYDPTMVPSVDDLAGYTIGQIAELTGNTFRSCWLAYYDLGYRVAKYHLPPVFGYPGPGLVFLQDRWDDPTMEAAYSWMTGTYEIPVRFTSRNDMECTIAHEMFHMVQNQSFSALGNMGYNRALMEMSAEYASRKVAYTPARPLSTVYQLERSEGLNTVNDTHEYANAAFLDCLARQGVDFRELWDRLTSSLLVFTNFEEHLFEKTRRPLDTLYREFRHAALFDADTGSEYAPALPMELRWDTGHDHRFLLRSYGERALDYARAVLQLSDPAASVRVAVEATEPVPDGITVQAFLLPGNQQQPGGVKPFALLSGTPLHPYALTPCSRTDAVYVTAYFRPAGASVGLRVLRIGLQMTPERLDPAEFAKWYTFRVTAGPLPTGLRNVRFTWDFGDGSEVVEVLREPRPASDAFSHVHAFTKAENATYTVTFTLWDADTGWELGRATSTVVVDAKPSVRIEPAVASVTEGGQVALAAAGTLLPAAALYTWTFGDGTPGVGPGPAASVQHLYATPGEFTAKVTVATADRGGIVAENTCRVIVHPKPSDTYPDHVCVPLSGIDYSVLARVEEADTGQTRNVYFLTPGGQRHGRFHKLRADGTTETCGVYIHGRREGTWVDYWRPGVKRRVYHFLDDVRDGMDRGWESDSTLAWEQHYIQDQPSGESRLWLFGSWQTTPWPELHGVDATYETRWPNGVVRERCDFVGNRRHGSCVLGNDAAETRQQGTFTHGTKTGVWQYRDAAGVLQAVNHGDGGAR